ncbi:MAG: hypothetical protein Q9159_000775 [Coniocarpon cinnabarinum]
MAQAAKRDNWDDSDDESTPPSSPPPAAAAPRQRKFDDEEDDSDVLESWDAAEDSDAEREKAKAAAEAKARSDAQAQANKKSKSQRIEEHRMANMRRRQQEEEDDENDSSSEDEAEKRIRMRRMEKEADLKNAEDLFGGVSVSDESKSKVNDRKKSIVPIDPANPGKTLDLSSLKLFQPNTRDQFQNLREAIGPLIASNSQKAPYGSFAVEFAKTVSKDMTSEQIKKVASGLTTLANEKMKEEKAADKGSKKTKAAKSKTTLNASRDTVGRADLKSYEDDGLADDDFM